MSVAVKQLILVLDVYADVALEDALGPRLAPEPERVVLRWREFGAPPPAPDDTEYRTLPWAEYLSAVHKLHKAALGAAEAAGAQVELWLGGVAPLPLFAYLAQMSRPLSQRRFLFNYRKGEETWQILPLQSVACEKNVRLPFDTSETYDSPLFAPEGRLAVYVSNLALPVPYKAIDDFFRRHKQDLAALVTLRSQGFVDLDERSSPQAFTQISEFLASLTAKHPAARGVVFFVRGPTALASMVGFALSNDVTEPWFTNNVSGIYHVAAPVLLPPPSVEDLDPALRLRSMRVRGVKSIRDSTSISLPKFGILVGRNSSGKSSLLEALQWLHDAVLHGLDIATREKFHSLADFRNKSCTKIELDLELEGETDEQLLHYSVVIAEGPRGVPVVEEEHCRIGQRAEIFTENKIRWIDNGPSIRDPDQLALAHVRGTDAVAANRLRIFLRRMVFLRLNPKQLARLGSLQPDPQGPLLDEEGAGLPALIESLPPEGLEAVVEGMQAVFSESASIQGVNVIRSQIEQTGVLALDQVLVEQVLSTGARKMRPYRLPAWVLSEGTRRLSALFSLLGLRPAPSLLVIEEIENGLDPWTLGHVLDALAHAADSSTNILLTTHSPFFLDKFDPDQVIHVVYKDGESLYRPITEYEDVLRYEGDVRPGVMYISDFFSKAR